ncbi:hypothetical protein V1515DRAFT_645109 [Lipomyces mesembrius]
MRFLTVAAISGLVAVASAQSLSSLPACAQTCAGNAIGATGCSALDIHCFCTATSFMGTIASCISTACDQKDQQTTVQFAESLCLSASVTLSGIIDSLLTPVATSTMGASSSAPVTSSEVITSSKVSTTSMPSSSAMVTMSSMKSSSMMMSSSMKSSSMMMSSSMKSSSMMMPMAMNSSVSSAMNMTASASTFSTMTSNKTASTGMSSSSSSHPAATSHSAAGKLVSVSLGSLSLVGVVAALVF